MKKKLFRKVLALIMVLSLIPCWGVSAWAAEVSSDGSGPQPVTAESVDVTSSDPYGAEGVYAYTGAPGVSAEVEISGPVSVSNSAGDAEGVGASAFETGSSASVSAESVTVVSTAGGDTGATAVSSYSSVDSSSASVTVSGDVSATASGDLGATGISSIAVNPGAASSASTGDVTAISVGKGDAEGISASAGGENTTTVVTAENVSASTEETSSGEATGIIVGAYDGGNVEITTDDVESEADGSGIAIGVDVSSNNDANATVVSGKIEVETDQSNLPDLAPDSVGINVFTHDGGTAEVTANEVESVAQAGTAHGVDITALRGSDATVTVNGPMTVTGVEYAQGVSMDVGTGSTVNLTVNDDVTVEAEGNVYGPGNGMYINMDGGEAYVVVNGDVSSSGSGILTAGKSGLVDVTIDGNLTAETTGLAVQTELDTKFLITESIKADGIGIEIGNGVTKDNLEVTVWQIDTNKVNGEDHVAVEGGDKKVTEASKKVEQSINYIIKITPSQQSMISLSGTTEKDGFQTAHMGDKVAMKVNVPAGYQLTGAFGDKGETLPLKTDENGNYYMCFR